MSSARCLPKGAITTIKQVTSYVKLLQYLLATDFITFRILLFEDSEYTADLNLIYILHVINSWMEWPFIVSLIYTIVLASRASECFLDN